jgi:hypothetical protein
MRTTTQSSWTRTSELQKDRDGICTFAGTVMLLLHPLEEWKHAPAEQQQRQWLQQALWLDTQLQSAACAWFDASEPGTCISSWCDCILGVFLTSHCCCVLCAGAALMKRQLRALPVRLSGVTPATHTWLRSVGRKWMTQE